MADDLAGAFEQRVQDVERAAAEPDRLVGFFEDALGWKQPKGPEGDDVGHGLITVERMLHRRKFQRRPQFERYDMMRSIGGNYRKIEECFSKPGKKLAEPDGECCGPTRSDTGT
ncbi:MAG: hypothetical protein WDN08_21205 [Rhizomicrobium sp.]